MSAIHQRVALHEGEHRQQRSAGPTPEHARKSVGGTSSPTGICGLRIGVAVLLHQGASKASTFGRAMRCQVSMIRSEIVGSSRQPDSRCSELALAVPVGNHGRLRRACRSWRALPRDLCLDAGEVIEAAEGVVSRSIPAVMALRQCRKWRMPVNTWHACASAAAMASLSRIDPPG